MKLFPANFTPVSRPAARGFTLAEMLVAITIFMVVIFATVSVQLYASRVYTLTAATLGATEQARLTMNDIRDKIREARVVNVGNYTWSQNFPPADFMTITNGLSQQGNALIIYPTTATNSFTLVFLQPSSSTMYAYNANSLVGSTNSLILLAYNNGALSVSNDVADFITNQIVFDAENFQGTVLTNFQNNYLVHMTLDFSQWRYPAGFANPTNDSYNYFQLNTVITRRDTD
jgi:prepilin-type N-terminal cleavage/methylation domain-containing protein